ncbi:MAG: hypothetical protein ACK55Z_34225, partial [bacterium]
MQTKPKPANQTPSENRCDREICGNAGYSMTRFAKSKPGSGPGLYGKTALKTPANPRGADCRPGSALHRASSTSEITLNSCFGGLPAKSSAHGETMVPGSGSQRALNRS